MSNQETRTRLLETALDLIWQSNYNSVGVNEICKKAGVTKGSFYHHFESKAVLFCEATNFYWDKTKQCVDEIVSPLNSPMEQLKQFIQFIFERKFNESEGKVQGCPYFSCGSQTGLEDEMIMNNLREMSQKSIKYNIAMIRTLQAGGFLQEPVDVERCGRLISQYIQGAMAYARIDGDIAKVKQDFPEGLFKVIGLKREHWFNPFSACSSMQSSNEQQP